MSDDRKKTLWPWIVLTLLMLATAILGSIFALRSINRGKVEEIEVSR